MTHTEIIQKFLPADRVWGKYDRLSDASGLSVSDLTKMTHRGRIPSRAWTAFVSAAEKLDVEGVTYEALAKSSAEAEAA